MEKFEYKTVVTTIPALVAGFKKDSKDRDNILDSASTLLEKSLNELGIQGWELVNSMPVATHTHGMTGRYISIFKRKIQ